MNFLLIYHKFGRMGGKEETRTAPKGDYIDIFGINREEKKIEIKF